MQAEEKEDDADRGDASGGVGVVGGQPSEADGGYVFSGREGDVGEGFRTGSDEGACGGLGGVGEGCDGGTGGGGEQLQLWRELRSGFVGEKSGYRYADEGVGGVPEEVECGNFVGEELDCEEKAGDGDDPRVGERVQTWREDDPMEVCEDAEGPDGSVDVEPGGEAGGDDECGDGGGCEVH